MNQSGYTDAAIAKKRASRHERKVNIVGNRRNVGRVGSLVGNDDAIDLAVGYICEGDAAAVAFAEDNRSIADVLAKFGMTSSCLSVLGRAEVLWEVG